MRPDGKQVLYRDMEYVSPTLPWSFIYRSLISQTDDTSNDRQLSILNDVDGCRYVNNQIEIASKENLYWD